METNFNRFISEIKLTDPQKRDAKTKVKSVCETLHAKYYPDLTYDGSTKLLIGSYGKHTNIRPPKDIDVIFRMPDSEFERYDTLSGNKQSQLLQDVRALLKDTFSTTEEIRAFGKVIVVNFAEGTHTVELLPAWQLNSGAFKIPNTENGGSWEIWDPLAEIRNINESSKQTNKTKTLVRMLKCWVRNCGVPLKSYLIELLVVEYFKTRLNNQAVGDYAGLVFGFFEYLKSKRDGSIFSPATSTFVNLGEDWFSRAESAYSRAEKAIDFEKDNKPRDASLEWRKIFGDDFLIAEEKFVVDPFTTKVLQLSTLYPSDQEQHLPSDYGIEIKPESGYKIIIDAEITQKGFRKGWLTEFLQKRFPLLKGKKLEFQVQDINVPSPYYLMWKVRNFGEEAKQADCLRGEISRDDGYGTRTEHTLYHGEHYVECYAIKDNVCVAIGRILVPIGQNYD